MKKFLLHASKKIKWTVIMLFVVFVPLILFFTGCKKNSAKEETIMPISNVEKKTETIDKDIAFKTEDWKVYPYFGGPGEDSMYFTWSPQLVNNDFVITDKNLKAVFIKPKSGSLYQANQFILVSQSSSGYLYQFGEPLGKPGNLLLWWIQKQPGDRPDADSVFISLQ